MFFKYLALCTITLLAFASLLDAGHTHRHHHRRPRTPGALPALVKRQAVASSVEIPITNFNLLKSEFAAFGTWMKSFFSTEMDATKFNEEVQGHLDFIDSWLDAATSGSEPAPTALSNPVALQRRAGSESIEVSLAQLQLLRSETVEFKSWIGTGNTTNKDHLQLEVQTYESMLTF